MILFSEKDQSSDLPWIEIDIMIFEQELNEAFLDAFFLLFQQCCFSDKFFLKNKSYPVPSWGNEETDIKWNAKFTIEIEWRGLLVDVLSPKCVHAFDSESSLSEVTERIRMKYKGSMFAPDPPTQHWQCHNPFLFPSIGRRRTGHTRTISPVNLSSAVHTYFGGDIEHEAIFTCMGQSHGIYMADKANVDFLQLMTFASKSI